MDRLRVTMTEGLCSVGFWSRPFPSPSMPPAWAISAGSTARTGTDTGMMRGTSPLSSRERLAAKEGSENSTPLLAVEARTLFRFSSEPLASWKRKAGHGSQFREEVLVGCSRIPHPHLAQGRKYAQGSPVVSDHLVFS